MKYPNPCDENNGYHLRREEESPSEFAKFFAKAEIADITAEEIVANPLMAEFVIENGNQKIGMCVISYQNTKPKVAYVYLETEFHNKGIEEDIQKTLEEINQ